MTENNNIPVTYGEGTVKIIISLSALERIIEMDEFESVNGTIQLSKPKSGDAP